MMDPINLQEEFGNRWLVCSDVCDTDGGFDPWGQVVVCQNGFLYPAGENLIGAVTNRPGEIVRKLHEIEGVGVVVDGDDGANVLFHRAKLRFVRRIMRPHAARKFKSLPESPPFWGGP